MIRHVTLSSAAALMLALAACSKPAAEKTADDAEATAQSAADNTTAAAGDTAAGATAPGGAVSPPAPNEAVDSADKDGAPAAASNSFTEGQAKGHIENAGYTDVTGLTKTPDGMWTGSAKKDGKTVSVSVDFKGAVTAK